jgi:hypothetical protein
MPEHRSGKTVRHHLAERTVVIDDSFPWSETLGQAVSLAIDDAPGRAPVVFRIGRIEPYVADLPQARHFDGAKIACRHEVRLRRCRERYDLIPARPQQRTDKFVIDDDFVRAKTAHAIDVRVHVQPRRAAVLSRPLVRAIL